MTGATVANAMFARGRGGIEQAFVDYAQALRREGFTPLNLVQPGAAIIPALETASQPYETVRNLGEWDFMARSKLRSLLSERQIKAAIAHGNRAVSLLTGAAVQLCPVVDEAHNYSIKRFTEVDAAVGITRDITAKLAVLRGSDEHLYTIPNMVAMNVSRQFRPKPRHQPPVVGAIGRLVAKKGFDKLIYALGILRQRNLKFRAVIGGDGEERPKLEALVERHHMKGIIEFPGWIDDTQAFYDGIDIFCLPSLHEPFGIVLLEAMRAGVPIVTTHAEGPSEIVTHDKDALIVGVAHADQMADAIETLLLDQKRAAMLAREAFHTLRDTYSMEVVAGRISEMITAVARGWTPEGRGAVHHAA